MDTAVTGVATTGYPQTMLTMLTTLWFSAAIATPSPDGVALDTLRARQQSLPSVGPRAHQLVGALETRRIVRFAGGSRVRVGGRVDGFPVEGHLPVVAVDAEGQVLRVTGELPRRFHDSEAVSSAQSAAIAHDAVAAIAPHGDAREPRRIWWATGAEARAAWRVPVRSAGLPWEAGGFATWEVVVDGDHGGVLSLQRTSAAAEVFLYDPSPTVAMAERVELATADLTGPYVDARSCDVYDGSCQAWIRQATPNAEGDYLFHPRETAYPDPFAEVQAGVHADRMLDWLDRRFGLTLAYGTIDLFVNFPTANAFFGDFDDDGVPDISFGHSSSTGVDFGYDADVVYHELGHAVVDLLAPELPYVQADELGMSWVSGSINEGAADVFAMVLTGDPLVGEHAGVGSSDGAIRDLAALRRCPDDLRGEVHYDGEIFGALMWSLQEHEEVGADGGLTLEEAAWLDPEAQLGDLVSVPIDGYLHSLGWRWLSEAYPGLAE